MKKQLSAVLALTLLAGCGTASTAASTAPAATTAAATAETASTSFTSDNKYSVLAPTGAPGYALLPLADNDSVSLELVDGADSLQAAFVNPDPQYDVIVAPTNLGAKLISAGKTDYRLAAVVTTGNLYIVGTSEDVLSGTGTIALFGEQAVPGLVYKKLQPTTTMTEQWYNAVTDAQAALLGGQADAALLAEPAATATIAKGKEAGLSLTKVADLQQLWGDDGYPMASLFIKEDTFNAHKDDMAQMIDVLKNYADGVKSGNIDVAADLDGVSDPSVFGSVPSAMVAKTYTAMGINPDYARGQEESLQKFLDLFGVTLGDDAVLDFD